MEIFQFFFFSLARPEVKNSLECFLFFFFYLDFNFIYLF